MKIPTRHAVDIRPHSANRAATARPDAAVPTPPTRFHCAHLVFGNKPTRGLAAEKPIHPGERDTAPGRRCPAGDDLDALIRALVAVAARANLPHDGAPR
jgi:hypothetical protein